MYSHIWDPCSELLIGTASQGSRPCLGDRGRGVKNVPLERDFSKQTIGVCATWVGCSALSKGFPEHRSVSKAVLWLCLEAERKGQKLLHVRGTPLAN